MSITDKMEDLIPYDILKKYIPQDIINNYEIGEIEFWKYIPNNLKNQCVEELQTYYKENKPEIDIDENIKEKYLRERLQIRAGIKK